MAEDIRDKTERLAALGTQEKELQESIVDLEKEYTSWGNQMLSTGTELLSQRQQLHAAEAAAREAEKAALEYKIKTAELAEGEKESIKEQIVLLDKKIKSEKDSAKIAETQVELSKSTDSIFESIASRMLITKGHSSGFTKNLIKSVRVSRELGKGWVSIGKTLSGTVLNSFAEMFSFTNVLTSAMSKIFTVSLEFLGRASAAQAGFAKATGMLNVNIAAGMDLASGVNYEEASQAAIGLASSFRGFMDLQEPARKSLQRTAGRVERLGGSAQDLGKHVEFMGKAFGTSAKDAERMFTGVMSSAQDLGLTGAEATATFREFSGQMALYGPRIGKKFREIAAGAKASGLEIAEVVSLGEQFDTFEGATRAVGQLNAYLGGPVLDSMEMFYLQTEKGPEAVQKHVVESLRAQGKSIETMSYSEQKAFAETLNMKVGGFQKLMGFQSKEAKEAEEKAKKEEKRQERYNRVLGKTVSFAEQISQMMQSAFGDKEVMSGIQAMAKGFGKFLKNMMPSIQAIAKVMGEVMTIVGKMLAGVGPKTVLGILAGGLAFKSFPIIKGMFGAITGTKKFFTGGGGKPGGSAGNPLFVRVVGTSGAGGTDPFIGPVRQRAQRGTKERKALAREKWTERNRNKARFGFMGRGTARGMPTGRKGLGKILGKGLLGAGLKKIPGLGALAGLGFAAPRLMKGDFLGAGMESLSGLASIIPGIGTAASVALDASLMARDATAGPTASLIPPAKKQTKKDEAKADEQAKGIGKQIATAFIEEMKKNSEPSKVEFKFTFDDIVGENSPVHDVLWKSINNSMVKKTA